MKTISGGFFATTQSFPRPGFRSSPPSWATASPAAHICRCLCDKMLMTEGSGLYLAGPSFVKAAIGQVVDAEELGGAKMHAEVSGTVDFCEKDDPNPV